MVDFQYFLSYLLRKTPLIVVLSGGLLFALVRWKRHPRVSLWASIGLGFYIIEIFAFAFVYYLLPAVMYRMNLPASSSIFSVIPLVDDFIYAGILILLIAAALSQRPQKPVV